MKRRVALFTYLVMDMKAAEAELNRRAEAGWRLEKLWMGVVASFVPAEEPVCYCMDWYDPKAGDGEDYRILLADAGWQFRSRMSYWNIYEAPAGTAPIQTDSALEYQRFRKKALRRMAIGGAALGASVAVLFLMLGVLVALAGWEALAEQLAESGMIGVFLLTMPLAAAGITAWLIRMGLRLRQWCRTVGEGEPFPTPGRVSAAVAAWCCLLGYLYVALVVAAFLLDALGGHVYLGWCVGGIAGGLAVLKNSWKPEEAGRRRGAKVMLSLSAAALACVLLSPLGLADWICPPNPMEEPPRLLSAESNLLDLQREASLLVSYVEWDETHQNADGQDWDWLSGESWAVRGHWLADRLLEQFRTEAGAVARPPLDGYEDVWYVPAAEHQEDVQFDTWLVRRGNAVLRVTCDRGLLDGGRLEDILEQLEGSQ